MTCQHGAERLADLRVDGYNLKLEENGGFVGDRVRSRAFGAILDELRQGARETGADPLGDVASDDRLALDDLLEQEGTGASRFVGRAVGIYANAFADVVRRFLATEAWAGTEAIVVGGGLRESRLGEQAIRRAADGLTRSGHAVDLRPIEGDPDEAALLGAVHLRPVYDAGYDAMLAVDIGGSNIRAGVVGPGGVDGQAAEVLLREHWRHRLEPVDRDEMMGRLAAMLDSLVRRARQDDLRLAPFVGVGCPGGISSDGTITCGTQNLPGDWQEAGFNLPARLAASLPRIDGAEITVVLHNDAVLQGLSEVSRMRRYGRWGVLTIGTGLGNATFTNVPSRYGSENRMQEGPRLAQGCA